MESKIQIVRTQRSTPGTPRCWGYEVLEKGRIGPLECVDMVVLDNHFLLYSTYAEGPKGKHLFGVVDVDRPMEADRRLYEKARYHAEYIA